jgi:hypothetical protein
MTNALIQTTIGDTPPVDTTALWLSTSLKDLRISPARGDRRAVIVPDSTLAYEGTTVQEASVWYDGTYYNMLYTGNTGLTSVGLCLARAKHPLGPWTKHGRVIGQGAGGIAGKAYHSTVYVEGTTLYCTYTNDTAFLLATADISDPLTWTGQGAILTPSGSTPLGNSVIIKDLTAPAAERYKLWFDASYNNWQDGFAVASTPAGPYTMVQLPITSMWPDAVSQAGGPGGQGGGGWFGREGNDWIQYFHAGPKVVGSVPTEMYRATSTDLVNWTIDNNRQPIIRRMDTGEVDQIADAFLFQSPTGQWFIVWEGYDNAASTATIYCAPMQPTLKRFDGRDWVAVGGVADSGLSITTPKKSSVTPLTVDFSTASTTFVTMHTFYFRPSSTRCVVDVSIIGTNGTTQNQTFQVTMTGGATKPLGQFLCSTAAAQFYAGGKALFTGLTPDTLYTFTLQAKVGGNTFYCRPASFPALESCVAEVRDAAYPNPSI